jgi:hypothetical protein
MFILLEIILTANFPVRIIEIIPDDELYTDVWDVLCESVDYTDTKYSEVRNQWQIDVYTRYGKLHSVYKIINI